MTNTVLGMHSSTNIVKNPILNSIIYFGIAYISFFYLLPLVLEISYYLAAVIFSFMVLALGLTILKPLLAVFSYQIVSRRVMNQNRILLNRMILN